jgi:hypothetical protein
MFSLYKCLILSLLIMATPLFFFAQSSSSQKLNRRYKTGEMYRYRMTTDVTHNGKWQSTIIAVCELKVIADSAGIPYDEVRWISKKVFTIKDTLEHTAELHNTSPYRISLHSKGKLDIPPIQDAGMTGEITDFNTFFVAISPKLGIDALHKPGDLFKKPEQVKGNFANGKDILKGEDCLAVTNTLLKKDKRNAFIKTDFHPPSTGCLDYYTADMKQPVAGDTINNFQMVRYFSASKVNLFYGKEEFVINSTINTKDGKLQEASMINALRLNLKLNCNTDYSDCQNTFPFTIRRTIRLELLP